MPHSTCQAIFETAGNIIDDQMICFGGEGKDSCQAQGSECIFQHKEGPMNRIHIGNQVSDEIVF